MMQQHSSGARKTLTYGFLETLRGSAKQGRRQYGSCSTGLARCEYLTDATRGAQQPEKSSYMPFSQETGGRRQFLCRRGVLHVQSARCTKEVTRGLGAIDTYDPREVCCCWLYIAAS